MELHRGFFAPPNGCGSSCSQPSFATKAVRRGGGPFALMRLMGHSGIKTTQRYVHAASVQHMATALDKMNWV